MAKIFAIQTADSCDKLLRRNPQNSPNFKGKGISEREKKRKNGKNV